MIDTVRFVHGIGISGIGMSAAAKWFVVRGVKVSGSDIESGPIVEDLARHGVKIYSGHAAEQVPAETELVFFSSAVPETNPERVEARRRGIPEMSYAEWLGALTKQHSSIVVCGTNGKSTTTALLGKILEAAGYDPTVVVGAFVPGWKERNLRMGKGRFLVVEGCEYKENFLHLEPEMIVLTNVEEDHLDYFRDLAHIHEAFQTFLNKLQGKGMAVVNADDVETQKLSLPRNVSFGTGEKATYRLSGRKTEPGVQRASLAQEGNDLGELSMKIPGAFNFANAVAAIGAAMELGIPFETCARVVSEFGGIWRRFERLGMWKGAELVSDYGHHPTAVKGTVEAAREFFPGRRIVLCFQPHQHARTKELFPEFVEALATADVTLIPDIYAVAGRTEDDAVSSEELAAAIKEAHPDAIVEASGDLEATRVHLEALVQEGDVLILEGAGDIDSLARSLFS